jgi:hypothetical protein
MPFLELRDANRYRLAAAVNFWWPSRKGRVRASSGTIRDISSNGVMIISKQCPPVGVHIEITAIIPRFRNDTRPLEFHGEGSVVRIERSKTGRSGVRPAGFAASVAFFPEVRSGSSHLDNVLSFLG